MVSCEAHNQESMKPEDWLEDIMFYHNNLQRNHIDLYHSISKASFDTEIERIKSKVRESSNSEIAVGLMRLTKKIGDGHTSFPLWGKDQFHYPIKLKSINKQIYVASTTEVYRSLLGSRVIEIGDLPIVSIVEEISHITPFSENIYSTATRGAQYITNATVLAGLGVTMDSSSTQFLFQKNGKIFSVSLTARRKNHFSETLSNKNSHGIVSIDSIDTNLWFGTDAKKNTIYVEFRRYPSMNKMTSLSKKLLAFINNNLSQNIIIDLRGNYGGDFFVGLKMAQYLVLADSIDWKDGVYVLIDNETFSAAMSNAIQYSQILNAKIIGQPSGAKPAGYQDMGQFSLPNSNFVVTYSKRLYRFRENAGDALKPDVFIDTSIIDYIENKDRVLEWVFNDILQNDSRSKAIRAH